VNIALKYLLAFGGLIFAFGISFGSIRATEDFLNEFPKESYHVLESGKQNVGKTSFNWKNEAGQYVFEEVSILKINLFQKQQSLETKLMLKTNKQLQVQSFDYYMISSDSTLQVVGTRVGDNLRLEKIQAGSKQLKNILIQEPMILSSILRPYLLAKGLLKKSVGEQSFNAVLIEPSALASVPMTIKIKPKGNNFFVETTYLSHSLQSEVTVNGSLLMESADLAGMPLIAKPVSKKDFMKLKLEGTSEDLVEKSKVAFGKLDDARSRKSLSVRMDGIPVHRFQLNRHRQTLDGNILTIKTESLPEKTLPLQGIVGRKDLESYLAGDISIPVFDQRIQQKAREIVGEESDLWKRALKIHSFVYNHLEKDAYVSLPDALEALQTGKGDCNEHSVLYTALARAAGIPTRMVVGLVYSDHFYNGGSPGFYYHAWVEVFTGYNWVSIDPTWNQIPSDATHIAFVEGSADQQIQIAALMGKIKLSLVNMKPNQPI